MRTCTFGPEHFACPPAAFAEHRLFEPVGSLLARFPSPQLPGAGALNRLLEEVAPGAVSGSGRAIRFVLSTVDEAGYEERVFATGEVPTRADDWHDFFNALAWCVWPRAKAACNGLHLTQHEARRATGLAGRGACRDALTQLDECGIVIVSADPEIPALLAGHAWEEVFWRRRARLFEATRFLVFGHATWDQLRRPFFGLCAKAVYRTVGREWLAMPPGEQQTECDRWLAAHLAAKGEALSPRTFSPLPLLGIPGVAPESETPDYYRDTRQFRPRR